MQPFTLRRNIGVNTSPATGHRETQIWPRVWWETSLQTPPLTREQAGLMRAFFAQAHGRRGTFLLGDPFMKSSLAVNATLHTNASVGAFDVVAQFPVGTRGGVIAGEYVQFGTGGSRQLHLITTTGTIDATSGRLTIGIEPELRVALTGSSTPIEFANPQGVFSMTSNDLGWSADYAIHHPFAFACESVV